MDRAGERIVVAKIAERDAVFDADHDQQKERAEPAHPGQACRQPPHDRGRPVHAPRARAM
jgi:hypothetical protein